MAENEQWLQMHTQSQIAVPNNFLVIKIRKLTKNLVTYVIWVCWENCTKRFHVMSL